MDLVKTLSILSLLLLSPTISHSKTNSNRRLVKSIFEDYNKGLRPVLDMNDGIKVEFTTGIIQLLSVTDKTKTFQFVCFVGMSWRDQYLTWNSADYDNITSFYYPYSEIWKPDIILTNTPDLNDGPIADKVSTNANINNDGYVYNGFTAVLTATCAEMDMTKFPFDEHTCHMDFASWSYDMAKLDIVYGMEHHTATGFSLNFINNSEWDLKITGTEKLLEQDCCPNLTYPTIRIFVHLKRKPLYYLVNVIIPTVITCFISFFGMFSPSSSSGDRTEKTFLGITTLLAISLLMMAVSSQMPVTSTSIPLIGYLLGFYILNIAIAIVFTTIIMHIDVYGLRGKPLPKWARVWFLERLGKWLHLWENPQRTNSAKSIQDAITIINSNTKKDHESVTSQLDIVSTVVENTVSRYFEAYYSLIMKNEIKGENRRSNREEWAIFCRVLDMICLIIFISCSTIFTIIILSWKN